jgi:hypothetical protein
LVYQPPAKEAPEMETILESATIAAGPAGQLQESPGSLQGIVWGAVSLAAWLTSMEAPAHTLEIRDTLEALLPQLDNAMALQDEGEPLDNGALCAIACDSAHLMAAVLDPSDGFGLATLPQEGQQAAHALLGKLSRLGLMDCYTISGGRFGVWGCE